MRSDVEYNAIDTEHAGRPRRDGAEKPQTHASRFAGPCHDSIQVRTLVRMAIEDRFKRAPFQNGLAPSHPELTRARNSLVPFRGSCSLAMHDEA